MHYRIAGPEDLKACSDIVTKCRYYGDIDFAKMGGLVLLAEDDDGIQGCVWAIGGGEYAIADFLAVSEKYFNSGLGVRLVLRGLRVLERMGIRRVQSHVYIGNEVAMRMNRRLASEASKDYAVFSYHLGDTNGN